MGDGHWGCEMWGAGSPSSVTGQSPCPRALSCVGGRSDARWVGIHSQPHRFHVTSYPSPTATIPCPRSPTFSAPWAALPGQIPPVLWGRSLPTMQTDALGSSLGDHQRSGWNTAQHLASVPHPPDPGLLIILTASLQFPSSLPSQGDASCVRVSPLVWVSHLPKCPNVDVAPAQGTPPPAAASGPHPSLWVLD